VNIDLMQVGELVGAVVGSGVAAGLAVSRVLRGRLGQLVADVVREQLKAERPQVTAAVRAELHRDLPNLVRAVVHEVGDETRQRVARLEGSVAVLERALSGCFVDVSDTTSTTEAKRNDD
jgi:hypothetical protein